MNHTKGIITALVRTGSKDLEKDYKLIAAAPDLLEALKESLSMFNRLDKDKYRIGSHLRNQIEEAIKKAEA